MPNTQVGHQRIKQYLPVILIRWLVFPVNENIKTPHIPIRTARIIREKPPIVSFLFNSIYIELKAFKFHSLISSIEIRFS